MCESKLRVVKDTEIKNTEPCPLGTMVVERNKVNIIQGKVKKFVVKSLSTQGSSEEGEITLDLGSGNDSTWAMNDEQ